MAVYRFKRKKYPVINEIARTIAPSPGWVYIENYVPNTEEKWIEASGTNVKVMEWNRAKAVNLSILRYNSDYITDTSNLEDKYLASRVMLASQQTTNEVELVVFDAGAVVNEAYILFYGYTKYVGVHIKLYASTDDVTYVELTDLRGEGAKGLQVIKATNFRYLKVTLVESDVASVWCDFSEPIVFDVANTLKITQGAESVTHTCATSNDYMTVLIEADGNVTYASYYIDKLTYTQDEIYIEEV